MCLCANMAAWKHTSGVQKGGVCSSVSELAVRNGYEVPVQQTGAGPVLL